MFRKGYYTLYNDKEYKFVRKDKSQITLVSRDENEIKNGFKLKVYPDYYKNKDELPNIYLKTVSVCEVDDLYYINPKAKYKDELFYASIGKGSQEGKVLLDTGNVNIAKKYNFNRTDKYMYSKYVYPDEVEIIEEKEEVEFD